MGTSAPPTQQQAYQLPPDKLQAAIEFNRQLDALHFLAFAWALVVIWWMIRRRAPMKVPVVLGLFWIASLPFSIYRHWLGLHYGLSIEPWVPWLWNWLKAGLIEAGLTVLLVIAGFAIARRSPRRWWLYGWAGTVLFMVAATYAVPLVFDPLFNRFTPLERTQPRLIEPLRQVVRQAGFEVPAGRIFEMDAGSKTRTLNAYMTGFGATRRIVIWDTAARRLTPPQIQTVFAHELGHYALGHIPRSLAVAAAALFALFWLFRKQRVEPARLPRLLLLVTIVAFLSEPVVNSYSRWQERQADDYELRIMSRLMPKAGANSAAVDQIIAEISLDDPHPNRFIEFWLYDHPTTDSRMRRALAFDAQQASAPPPIG